MVLIQITLLKLHWTVSKMKNWEIPRCAISSLKMLWRIVRSIIFFWMKYSLCHDLRKCWIVCYVWAILMCMLLEVTQSSFPAILWLSFVVEVMKSESIPSLLQSFILFIMETMTMHGTITWLMVDCRRS